MPKLRFKISMSLDGYVAGPNQSVEHPLGVGGMRLHEWVFPLEVFRKMHGMAGGEVNANSEVLEAAIENVGATVMGRNMFGGHPGPRDSASPWNGWWGDNPPFHHPVFVITHYAREPLVLEGGTAFTFVTNGIHEALEQAKLAAAGRDVSLGGGAQVAQLYLKAGLIDEMVISLVPILLGRGERLLENIGDDLHGLELVRTLPTKDVVHLKFARHK